MSKYRRSWIEDLDIEEKVKLRKLNRRKAIDDTHSNNKRGEIRED